MKGTIRNICVSEKRGTAKKPIEEARLTEGYGIEGDAHAGHWHRQVSLIAGEHVDAFKKETPKLEPGAFGENIIIDGFDPAALPIGTKIEIEGVVLRTTQRGKECHESCEVRRMTGKCIMPDKGVFAEVIAGGSIKTGSAVTFRKLDENRPFTAAVVTVSDKGSRGERTDESGPAARRILEDGGYEVVEMLVVPDEQKLISKELIRLSDMREVELIVTSGGTGFSMRDRTPEATLNVAEREAPGIAELIRLKSMQYTERACLGRGVSVLRGRSLIINLPGSPKAVSESLEAVIEPIAHGLAVLRGSATDCGRK